MRVLIMVTLMLVCALIVWVLLLLLSAGMGQQQLPVAPISTCYGQYPGPQTCY